MAMFTPSLLVLPAAWRSSLEEQPGGAAWSGSAGLCLWLTGQGGPSCPRSSSCWTPPSRLKYSQPPFCLWAPYKRWKYHLKCLEFWTWTAGTTWGRGTWRADPAQRSVPAGLRASGASWTWTTCCADLQALL
ncbi:hypothetical protein JOQ06_004041 [Pogonophryne albipinna]|uniref:Uncharacterized protein n=1 Tax=Pogonophryne albipinna TaxID=1090488 RepID=A0AAD6AC18_9TELE|nr:hypothetical protein JOQ06_004041 [Pogonophryne albipinna]